MTDARMGTGHPKYVAIPNIPARSQYGIVEVNCEQPVAVFVGAAWEAVS